MTQLPLIQAIPRFKGNEERVDIFVNGDEVTSYTTSGAVEVPSIQKFLATKDEEINDGAESILAAAQLAATNSQTSATASQTSAAASAASATSAGTSATNSQTSATASAASAAQAAASAAVFPATVGSPFNILRTNAAGTARENYDLTTPVEMADTGQVAGNFGTPFKAGNYTVSDLWSDTPRSVNNCVARASWVGTNMTIGGSSDTRIFTPTTSNSQHLVDTTSADLTVSGSETFRAQAVAKDNGYKYLRFRITKDGAFFGSVLFDLLAGTFVADAGITNTQMVDMGGGFWRCTADVVNNAGAWEVDYYVYDNTGSSTYAGDGTSGIHFLESGCRQEILVTAAGQLTTRVRKFTGGPARIQELYMANTQYTKYIKYVRHATGVPITYSPWRAVSYVSPTVLDYGAACDGTTVDNAAVARMASAEGYVRFPAAMTSRLTTMTFLVPVFFDTGAAITIDTGNVITFQNRIVAPKQHIFKGVGEVALLGDTVSGEDSKVCHIAWWGVFPVDGGGTIVTTAFQRAVNAFTYETREGTLELDNGSYCIDNTIALARGLHLKGSGTRRTIIDLVGTASYTAFTLTGDATKISGIQFEQPSGSVAHRTGILIDVSGSGCELDDIRMWNSRTGIRITGTQCTVKHISSTYNNAITTLAGSATILLQASGAIIDDVKVDGAANGPEAIVAIQGHSANVSNTRISNVFTSEASIPVRLNADTSDITNCVINGVIGAGDSTAVVDIRTSGTSSVTNVAVSNLVGNSGPDALVRITQGSSGATRYVSVSNGSIYGSGDGCVVTQTAGTLSEVTFGDSVNTRGRTNPFVRSGTMSKVTFPTWFDGIVSGRLTLSDDTAASIVPPYNGGHVHFTFEGGTENSLFPAVNRSGTAMYDVGSTVAIEKASAGGAAFAVVATDVTGTTGTDGNLTIGVTAGNIRVENRSGGVAVVRYSFS